ncbi:hypothetical protein GCM10010270_14020 [Streptomyces violaceus]|nr:hypothetical protein GCM10010270_14020 [Streptomyces janthinus]
MRFPVLRRTAPARPGVYRPLMRSHPDIGFRLHDSTLYNSVYRAEDEMLVNPHVYGPHSRPIQVDQRSNGRPDTLSHATTVGLRHTAF